MANTQSFKQFLDENLDILITCPVTKCVFISPVVVNDGFIYEEYVIKRLMSNKSPMTRETVTSCVKPNIIKLLIQFGNRLALNVCKNNYILNESFSDNISEIFNFVRNKDYNYIKYFKNYKLDMVSKEYYNTSFIQYITNNYVPTSNSRAPSYLQSIEYILNNCENMYIKHDGKNIMHYFAKYCKNKDVIIYLLDRLIKDDKTSILNEKDHNLCTPIDYIFTKNTHYEIIQKLEDMNINTGAYLLITINDLINNDMDYDTLIKYIDKLDTFNKCDSNGDYPIIKAISNNRLDIVKYLVGKGEDICSVKYEDMNAIVFACRKNRRDILKFLVEHCNDIDKINESFGNNNWRLIHVACYYTDADTISYLLDKGINIIHPITQFNGSTVEYYPINLIELNGNISRTGYDDIFTRMLGLLELQNFWQ